MTSVSDKIVPHPSVLKDFKVSTVCYNEISLLHVA